MTIADILLVHGSWHGAWAWDDIAKTLREHGHRVVAPDLLGLGSTAADLKPGIGLWQHVDQLQAIVEDENLSDLILVGHSYGGALVHGLEARIGDRLRAVVHLEGAIPEPGSSIMNMWPEERRRATLDAVAANGDGWRVPPPDPRDWGALDDKQIAWLTPKLTPQSIKTYRDKMPTDLESANCPHYYLYANDRNPQPYAAVIERFSKARRWQLAATYGGHELMFTNPQATLDLIEIANEGAPLPAEL
ncbi:MAG: alpha/beta fold hydrolase [Geminicoccaceae bacterium]